MSTMEENLLPIAILCVLIFSEKDENLVTQLQELGVLRLTDDNESSQLNKSPQDSNRSQAKGRHLTRAISINAHGKVEIERQFVNGIEKFWVSTKTDEPLKLDSLEKETFVVKRKEIRLNFQLRNVQLFDVNNFVIRGTKSLSKNDWAKITFDLPKTVKLTCRYHIDGMVMGKTVHDSGTAEIKLHGVEVTGKVKVNVTEEEINILELDLSYTFEKIAIEKIAIILAGMTKDDIAKLFNETTKNYLKENMEIVASRLAREIKVKLNQRLKNISSAKIVNAIKNEDEEENDDIKKLADSRLVKKSKK